MGNCSKLSMSEPQPTLAMAPQLPQEVLDLIYDETFSDNAWKIRITLSPAGRLCSPDLKKASNDDNHTRPMIVLIRELYRHLIARPNPPLFKIKKISIPRFTVVGLIDRIFTDDNSSGATLHRYITRYEDASQDLRFENSLLDDLRRAVALLHRFRDLQQLTVGVDLIEFLFFLGRDAIKHRFITRDCLLWMILAGLVTEQATNRVKLVFHWKDFLYENFEKAGEGFPASFTNATRRRLEGEIVDMVRVRASGFTEVQRAIDHRMTFHVVDLPTFVGVLQSAAHQAFGPAPGTTHPGGPSFPTPSRRSFSSAPSF
ncbi:hypothetical protein BU23DRAFT_566718 [Bimuria novae-zelandiae CBS 107.79]|uniref:Uncharacterized protein n=1 Tax=Bimuria novae-zelandiae CBS 107.79 TaxID=1447943 RepID=A0A6A5VD95_9PLEO|nr:hypothetical protein BU23DRAFT_566718 [Bimuria novae-zelandiae CBS 107.79]